MDYFRAFNCCFGTLNFDYAKYAWISMMQTIVCKTN